jgi:hypothetical protein
MNERMLELAKQAGLKKDHGSDREYIGDFDWRLFGDLIVQECVEQLELVRKYRYDRIQPLETQQTIIDECQYQIKQHFGVE